jgi:glycoside/pentoside/hexuronide:cation symporter, GPH family
MCSKSTLNKSITNNIKPSQLWAYGLLALPLAMLGIPLYLYLPSYYHHQFGLSLTDIGLALLLARLIDVITDPLIGMLSDRFLPKVSRQWQVITGFSLLLVGLYGLFFPAADSVSLWQLGAWSFITYLGWTWIQIPYLTLAAEISTQEYDKTRLTAWREGFSIVGMMLALLLPLLTDHSINSVELYQLFWLVVLVSLLIAGTALVKVRHLPLNQSSATPKLATQLQQLQAHRTLLRLFPIYFLNNLANALPATLFVFFVSDYLQLEAEQGLFLLTYFIAGILALPLWLRLSRRWGKARTWQASMLLASLSFTAVFALDAGDFTLYWAICLLTGLSLAIDLAMPASMQADICQEHPELAGTLFGLWGMITKLTLALAVGISLPLIEWAQSQSLNWPMLLCYAGLPILLKLSAIQLLQRNPT